MEQNVLVEGNIRNAVTDLYEKMNELMQDSDREDDKLRIQEALKGMTANTSYMMLGDEGSGKTTLLHNLFDDMIGETADMSCDICEFRWGEEKYELQVSQGYQKRFLPNENIKGLSIIDTKSLKEMNRETFENACRLTMESDVVFAVFDAANIKNSKVWDVLENVSTNNAVFFLTKCDLMSSKELDENLNRLHTYMKDCGIQAPVFPVSTEEQSKNDKVVSLTTVREYIRNEIIGENPIMKKQRQNVEDFSHLLTELKTSFELRKKQYEADALILEKINTSLDDFVTNRKDIMASFLKDLEREISKDIDAYANEIISKMDPYKIKERFRTRQDFMDYLNMVNDNYQKIMTDSVNHKVMEAMKKYMGDLELIFQQSVGYFNERESILQLDDAFYGTLSKSRMSMVNSTKEMVVTTGQYYKTLSEASETLFMQVWEERRKYDNKIRRRKALSNVGGGVAGIGTVVGIETATDVGLATALGNMVASTKLAALGSLTTAVSGIGLVVIGCIAGAVLINNLAKILYDPAAANKMEKTTAKCIEQFRQEIDNTRLIMTNQVTEQVTAIFENEITAIDSCFAEFRMSVNIDEQKLPALEKKLLETEQIIKQINTL